MMRIHECKDCFQSEEKLVDTGPKCVSPEKTAGKIKFSLQYDSIR